MIGSLDLPGPGGDLDASVSEDIKGREIDAQSQSNAHAAVGEPAIKLPREFAKFYRSPGPIGLGNPMSFFLGFFTINVMIKSRRRMDRLLD